MTVSSFGAELRVNEYASASEWVRLDPPGRRVEGRQARTSKTLV
jgi:hypothetical protein